MDGRRFNGEFARHRRKNLNLSTEQVAARLGHTVTRWSVYKYETGGAQPKTAVANRLADVLGVTTADLYAPVEVTQ